MTRYSMFLAIHAGPLRRKVLGIGGAFCNPWAASLGVTSALASNAGTAAPRAWIRAVAFYFASLAVIACMRTDHCPCDQRDEKCLMEGLGVEAGTVFKAGLPRNGAGDGVTAGPLAMSRTTIVPPCLHMYKFCPMMFWARHGQYGTTRATNSLNRRYSGSGGRPSPR